MTPTDARELEEILIGHNLDLAQGCLDLCRERSLDSAQRIKLVGAAIQHAHKAIRVYNLRFRAGRRLS